MIALRRVLFAVELLDPVSLNRISYGMKEVKAHGLSGKPIISISGLFVWLHEDISQLEKVSIRPGQLPYEETEIAPDQLNRVLDLNSSPPKWPLTSIQLAPRADYPFDRGVTALRGKLVEDRVSLEPVPKACVRFRWLDQDGDWQLAPTVFPTSAESDTSKGGEFVAVLRLAPSDEPQLDAAGNLTVRLVVRRDDVERVSADLAIPMGRVLDPSIHNRNIVPWDELRP